VKRAILDASAVLAVLFREPGAELVRSQLASARISSLSYCEVLVQTQKLTHSLEDAKRYLDRLNLTVVPFDAEQAALAAKLSLQAEAQGLSLAARACLSLAMRDGEVVLTADRTWAKLNLGFPITVIR
jgi:ribonuclease VapC